MVGLVYNANIIHVVVDVVLYLDLLLNLFTNSVLITRVFQLNSVRIISQNWTPNWYWRMKMAMNMILNTLPRELVLVAVGERLHWNTSWMMVMHLCSN